MCVPGCGEAVQRAMSRRGFFRGAAATAAFAAVAATPAQRAAQFHHGDRPDAYAFAAFPTFFGTPGITIEKRYTLKKDGANVELVACRWSMPGPISMRRFIIPIRARLST